jgi:hypothetical protein
MRSPGSTPALVRRTRLALALLGGAGPALLACVAPAVADVRSGVDVGAGWVPPVAGARFVPLRLAPSLLLDRPGARLSVDGAAVATDGSLLFERARASGSVLVRATRRVAGELDVDVLNRATGDGFPPVLYKTNARAHYVGGRWGAWLGAGTIATSRAVERSALSLLDLGAWARRRRFTVTSHLDQGLALLTEPGIRAPSRDTLVTGLDRGPRWLRAPLSKYVTVTTAQAGVQWSGRRLELESALGVAVSQASRPQRWLRASGAWWFTRGVALTAAASTRPLDVFRLESRSRACVTAALRVATARAASPELPLVAGTQAIDWTLRPLDGGRYALAVRAPGARTVEVMGDVTGWAAVSLSQKDSELWEVSLAMSPGVHQINLRLDGGSWTPPPGAPTQSDGFNGTAGVLVVE